MITRLYGAHPLHLVLVLGCLAGAGYAALQVGVNPLWWLMLIWFSAAVLLHDLVLFPVYAATDRALVGVFGRLVNYPRVPLLGCALTFALFFPGIIRQGEAVVRGNTGLDQEPYLIRWLTLCAAMFAVSGVVLVLTGTARAIRSWRSRRAPDRAATALDGARAG
ncbi:MAG: hypothetical protein ACT4O0_08300 [Pseudonocardia sp.]